MKWRLHFLFPFSSCLSVFRSNQLKSYGEWMCTDVFVVLRPVFFLPYWIHMHLLTAAAATACWILTLKWIIERILSSSSLLNTDIACLNMADDDDDHQWKVNGMDTQILMKVQTNTDIALSHSISFWFWLRWWWSSSSLLSNKKRNKN